MGSGSEVMFQHNSNQVTEEHAKQKLRQSEVECGAFDIAYYYSLKIFLVSDWLKPHA